jgi:hypothetical protein
MEAIHSTETSVLTWTAQRRTPEEWILLLSRGFSYFFLNPTIKFRNINFLFYLSTSTTSILVYRLLIVRTTSRADKWAKIIKIYAFSSTALLSVVYFSGVQILVIWKCSPPQLIPRGTQLLRLSVGKPMWNRPLGRPRRRWIDSIKIDLVEIGWSGVDCVDRGQNRYRWRALVNAVMNH